MSTTDNKICISPILEKKFKHGEAVYTLSQVKHQLDATLCRFYFCRVTLHGAHHQEYLKLVQRPLVHVLSLQVSHHISLLGPPSPNKEM